MRENMVVWKQHPRMATRGNFSMEYTTLCALVVIVIKFNMAGCAEILSLKHAYFYIQSRFLFPSPGEQTFPFMCTTLPSPVVKNVWGF